MKRYLLFAGERYYPSGGASDFQKSFDNIIDAKVAGHIIISETKNYEWFNILDTETGYCYEYDKSIGENEYKYNNGKI